MDKGPVAGMMIVRLKKNLSRPAWNVENMEDRDRHVSGDIHRGWAM